ncbi:hypothetical protein [Pedobacter sp. NJ-S-72]
MKYTLTLVLALVFSVTNAQTAPKKYHQWASTPPLGWNSWDCFGTTVTEQQIKEQADAMAKYLLPSGYNYLTVDIEWYEPESKGHAYDPKGDTYHG